MNKIKYNSLLEDAMEITGLISYVIDNIVHVYIFYKVHIEYQYIYYYIMAKQ